MVAWVTDQKTYIFQKPPNIKHFDGKKIPEPKRL